MKMSEEITWEKAVDDELQKVMAQVTWDPPNHLVSISMLNPQTKDDLVPVVYTSYVEFVDYLLDCARLACGGHAPLTKGRSDFHLDQTVVTAYLHEHFAGELDSMGWGV
jgi:hypothetical protein